MGRKRTLWQKFKIWFSSTGINFPLRIVASVRSAFSSSSASSSAPSSSSSSSSSNSSASSPEFILSSTLNQSPTSSTHQQHHALQSHHRRSSSWWTSLTNNPKVFYLFVFLVPLLPSLLVSFYFSIPEYSLHKLDKRLERAVGLQVEAEQNRKLIESIELEKHNLKLEVESYVEDIKEHNDKMTKQLEKHLEYIRNKRRDELEIVGNEFVKPPIEGELNYLFSMNYKQMTRKGLWLVLFCQDQCHNYVARWQVIGREFKNIATVGMADKGVSDAFKEPRGELQGSVYITLTYQGERIGYTKEDLSAIETIKWVSSVLSNAVK